MIPYRFRHSFRKCVTILLWAALICAVFALCWLLWLNRYVIYTRDGAKLDFDQSLDYTNGQVAVAPTESTSVNIYFDDGEQLPEVDLKELTQLSGTYVTGDMLTTEHFDAVAEKLQQLPAGSTIMLDVKSIHGRFYYASSLGPASTAIPTQEVSKLIAQLHKAGYHLIAKLPAFRDYYYAYGNVSSGLYLANKRGLWLDPDRTYWLNPTKEDTLTHLISMVTELRVMGFNEVVFSDFRMPDTNEIFFEGDRAEAVQTVANTLVKVCTTDTFAVSFLVSDTSLRLPEGRCRLYFADVAAANAASTAAATGVAETDKRIVFLTDLMDTRYDLYGVLRPLKLDD